MVFQWQKLGLKPNWGEIPLREFFSPSLFFRFKKQMEFAASWMKKNEELNVVKYADDEVQVQKKKKKSKKIKRC